MAKCTYLLLLTLTTAWVDSSMIAPQVTSYTTPSTTFVPSVADVTAADNAENTRATTNTGLLGQSDVTTTLGPVTTLSQLGSSESSWVDHARYLNDITYSHTNGMDAATKSTFLNEEANEVDLSGTSISNVDCSSCSASERYRDLTGKCNNVAYCQWGSSPVTFRRIMSPAYEGDGGPRASTLSAFQAKEAMFSNSTTESSLGLTSMMMQFGQYVAHDLSATPGATLFNSDNKVVELNCCNHPTYGECEDFQSTSTSTCHGFIRSAPGIIDRNGKYCYGEREQVNTQSAFIDGSPIYGSSTAQNTVVRDSSSAKLRIWDENTMEYLPTDAGYCMSRTSIDRTCFVAGDTRPNVHLGMTLIHSLFLREHNKIVDDIEQVLADKGVTWDNEKIFQETRRIMGAFLQVITYEQYLPNLLGDAMMQTYELSTSSRTSYSSTTDPSIYNAFTTSAFRMGHSQIYPDFKMAKATDGTLSNEAPLDNHYFNPDKFYNHPGIALRRYILGLIYQVSLEVDNQFTDAVSEPEMFKSPYWNYDSDGDGSGDGVNGIHMRYGTDLAALNIMRGRDHGLPDYNTWANYINGFDSSDVTFRTGTDFSAYGDDSKIDLYVGGLAEEHVTGGIVGKTFAHIIGFQFKQTMDGDRYFYNHNGVDAAHMYTDAQVAELKKVSISKMVCRNADMNDNHHITADVFHVVDEVTNPLVQCKTLTPDYPNIETLISDQL